MIASPVLLDVHLAVGAWFGSHVLDSRLTQLVFCFLHLLAAAVSMRFPWPVTFQADFVVAVGACDQLLVMLGIFAVFGREVQPAVWGKTGQVRLSHGKSVLRDGFIIAVVG
jgi:preprotein translocase subunit SecF